MAKLSKYFSRESGSSFNFPILDLGVGKEDVEYIEDVLLDWSFYSFPPIRYYVISIKDTPVNPIILDVADGSLGPNFIVEGPPKDMPIFVEKDPPTQDLAKTGITEERGVTFRAPRSVFRYFGVIPKIGDIIEANDEEKYLIQSIKPERYFVNFPEPIGVTGIMRRIRRSSLDNDLQRDFQEAQKNRYESYNKYMRGEENFPKVIRRGIEYTNPHGNPLITVRKGQNVVSQGYINKKKIEYRDPLLYTDIEEGDFKI